MPAIDVCPSNVACWRTPDRCVRPKLADVTMPASRQQTLDVI
ncbi:hypothetical protein C7S15_5151 [Burkholderia cepacia]|nr:hypothetical protein [Burkholderia cepacia]